MYAELRKIMHVLTQNRGEAHNGLVKIDQKLNNLETNIKAEELTCVNALMQNRTDQEWKEQDESRDRHSHPEMSYHLWGNETRAI